MIVEITFRVPVGPYLGGLIEVEDEHGHGTGGGTWLTNRTLRVTVPETGWRDVVVDEPRDIIAVKPKGAGRVVDRGDGFHVLRLQAGGQP